MTTEDDKHGTYYGYCRHYLNGEKPCAACREAGRRYYRERRAQPGQRRLDNARQRAHGKARTRLTAEHRDEYREHYATALAAASGGEEPPARKIKQRAQRTAQRMLIDAYPDEWERLYAEEKDAEGIE